MAVVFLQAFEYEEWKMDTTTVRPGDGSPTDRPVLSNPINDIVLDSYKAIKAGAYRSALALVLTLPDICWKAEGIKVECQKTDGVKGKGKYNSYAKWFDDNVLPLYDCEWEKKKAKVPVSREYKYPVFDGMACYRLRNSVLHAGNIDLSGSSIDEFELTVSPERYGGYSNSMGVWKDALSTGEGNTTRRCSLDLVGLCDAISKCALDCYERSNRKEEYQKFSWKVSIVEYAPSSILTVLDHPAEGPTEPFQVD